MRRKSGNGACPPVPWTKACTYVDGHRPPRVPRRTARRFSTDNAPQIQLFTMKIFAVAVILVLAGGACAAAITAVTPGTANLKQLGFLCLSAEGGGGSTSAGARALCSLSSDCGNDDIPNNKNLAGGSARYAGAAAAASPADQSDISPPAAATTAVSTACDTSSAGEGAHTRAVPSSGGYGSARHMIQTDMLDATNLTSAAAAACASTWWRRPPARRGCGKKNFGIPAFAGTQGHAPAQPIHSPEISSRCGSCAPSASTSPMHDSSCVTMLITAFPCAGVAASCVVVSRGAARRTLASRLLRRCRGALRLSLFLPVTFRAGAAVHPTPHEFSGGGCAPSPAQHAPPMIASASTYSCRPDR